MAPWKLILSMVVLLLPGGSLVLLAMVAARAWGAGRERLKQSAALVGVPEMTVDGAKG